MIAQELFDRKKNLENMLQQQERILKENHVGLKGSLVDDQGFPLEGIDIPAVTSARRKINEINTDYNLLMKEIEKYLEQHFQKEEGEGNHAIHSPFAKVKSVVPDSPAFKCGICVHDQIIQLGSITHDGETNSWMKTLSSYILSMKDQTVDVKLIRQGIVHTLQLIPCEWSGKGLLGLELIPL
ncbi:hypothetical protein ROZALSC1DRAFT_16082 [Rozella allomycis CSF55]|uniref:Probable 26S proteasome regulatory subunit p27 n=1 Tax=Rozella allomycis (strain CSF55) TaxID=988480 RepID=A0A4P9YE51_ROZAC|nr:hypothetical protein ROZALSC1DRAFT_16082 [Rozella allomycis CSF55]